ncbi:Prolyl-tRNA editing protein ProX [Caballeronia pedi]|uniref:Prolyl-tRNA editing protein ProX n=1 Tax=Caballeronia pedi TaxID=1777141 RepID=A0A158D9R4_9BURK|nr:prolyl-tRNA synthetase associated domain-containing protein [Caballeronia pedi]SAK91395.1 Prolyl-tRNA editing protein ProX [Caballeronia pedi]
MLGKHELLKRLDEWEIPFSCEEHGPVLNMAESGKLTLSLEGTRSKNLLLQDRKEHYFLIVTTAVKALDLTAIAQALGCKRLSFASSDKLFELLGIRTGSLSPLALVNDTAGRVRLVLDTELIRESTLLFHPLENNASIALSPHALEAFLTGIGHRAEWKELAGR